MNTSIIRTATANLLLVGILAATFGGLVMLYVPLEYAAIVTLMVGAFIKADDYRIRRARRRDAQPVPVTA